MRKAVLATLAALTLFACGSPSDSDSPDSGESGFTHGPTLGRLSSDGVGVWARTLAPERFQVRYGMSPGQLNSTSDTAETTLDRDNTGWVHLNGLSSNTKYFYELYLPDSGKTRAGGSFHTLPAVADVANPEHNPKVCSTSVLNSLAGTISGPAVAATSAERCPRTQRCCVISNGMKRRAASTLRS